METYNAKITRAHLGFEDHGILSSMICWESDGYGGGFGGLGLTGPCMSIWVESILKLFSFNDWNQLNGTLIRVRCEGFGGRTVAIGHIIEDKWVTMEEIQAKMKEALNQEARAA